MKSLWNDNDTAQYRGDLRLRVYTSRRLGCNPPLVQPGRGGVSAG